MDSDQPKSGGSITSWLNQLADPSLVESAAQALFPRLLQLGTAIASSHNVRQSDAASIVPTEVANLMERVRSGGAAFPSRVALAGYLAQTVRCRAIDRSRSRKRLQSLSGFLEGEAIAEFIDDEIPAGPNEHMLLADCNQLDERLVEGLERSGPRTQRAIVLFLEGFRKIEIAAQLQVAPSTVTLIFQEFAAIVAAEIGDDL